MDRELTPQIDQYLEDFEPGTVHVFQLRRGGLGFAQLYLPPVHARMVPEG